MPYKYTQNRKSLYIKSKQLIETDNKYDFKWLGFIKENWSWIAPLVYVYVTATGMIQAWLQYNAFGINIFEFSEINDFLLAAFREPVSLLAILAIIAYGFIGLIETKIKKYLWKNIEPLMESGRLENTKTNKIKVFLIKIYFPEKFRRHPWLAAISRKSWSIVVALLIISAPFIGPMMLNDYYGPAWKYDFIASPDRAVKVAFKDIKKAGSKGGWVDNLVFLGTTDKYIFFYNKFSKEVIITTLGNILLIRHPESPYTLWS